VAAEPAAEASAKPAKGSLKRGAAVATPTRTKPGAAGVKTPAQLVEERRAAIQAELAALDAGEPDAAPNGLAADDGDGNSDDILAALDEDAASM
jgi:hypothetical protein